MFLLRVRNRARRNGSRRYCSPGTLADVSVEPGDSPPLALGRRGSDYSIDSVISKGISEIPRPKQPSTDTRVQAGQVVRRTSRGLVYPEATCRSLFIKIRFSFSWRRSSLPSALMRESTL